ncbi:Ion transport peptide-like protein [Sarcoptes scabiei]|nr:Ion transport peptide-like protein [Sarcoptes scabiei]
MEQTFCKDLNQILDNLSSKNDNLNEKSNQSLHKNSSESRREKIVVAIKENHRINLEKLSISELQELLRKQEKIVNDKKLLSRLNDNGKKAREYYAAIKSKIDEKINQVDETEKLFEAMRLDNNIPIKDAYVEQRIHLVKNEGSSTRFNIPIKFETYIPVKNHEMVHMKIKKSREVIPLDCEESLRRLTEIKKQSNNLLLSKLLEMTATATNNQEDEAENFSNSSSKEDYCSDDSIEFESNNE